MKIKILTLFVLVFGLSLAALAQDTDSVVVNPEPEPQRGYLIGPNDKIEGKVLNEPQFNFTATIDQNGKFQVPFFTEGIMAKCRTEKEIRADVTQLLSKYLRDPQVTVNVTERNSRPPVNVYGEVRKNVEVTLSREANLLDMISVAGGVTDKAGGLIQVTRTRPPLCTEENDENWIANDGRIPSRHYSLSSLRSGRVESNPVIYPGDIIVVPAASPIYVVGEVNVIGKEILVSDKGLPLTQAISQAGGLRREAKSKNIKIYRQVENSPNPKVISVNYEKIKDGEEKDIMLEPYDIVEVDKAKKSIAQFLLEVATGSVRQAGSILPQRVIY